MLPVLLNELEQKYFNVTRKDAATTSWNRVQLGVPKTHCYDALLLGDVTEIYDLPTKMMMATCVAKKRHQKAIVNMHGTPRGKTYLEYCRLDSRSRSKTRTPGHGTKQQRYGHHNIQSGDIAKIYHRSTKKWYTGRCSITNGTSVVLLGTKSSISGSIDTAKLIVRNKGFDLKYETVELQKE